MFRSPVLKPGFPSLLQHGQPEGLRRGWLYVLHQYGTVDDEVTFLIRRSVDLFVFPDFVHGGPYNRYNAGDIWAGSRGVGPNYDRPYCTSGQDCCSGGSPSSSSSSWAIWGVNGSSFTGVGHSSRWSSAAWRRGPSSAGGADSYDRLTPPHAFLKVWGLFLGYSTTSSRCQDQDALTSVLSCPASFSLGMARTGPRRCRDAGPWSSAFHVHDGTSQPSWTYSPPYRTSSCRTYASSSSSIVLPYSEKHLSYPTALSKIFFRVPRPLLSRWRMHPVWTLLLLRRCHKTLGTLYKALLRRWLEAGRLSC